MFLQVFCEKAVKNMITNVPNIIIDEWMRHLTKEEFQVLMYLCRSQFSDGRPFDQDFETATNLSLVKINAALSSLQKKGYIDKYLAICVATGEDE